MCVFDIFKLLLKVIDETAIEIGVDIPIKWRNIFMFHPDLGYTNCTEWKSSNLSPGHSSASFCQELIDS